MEYKLTDICRYSLDVTGSETLIEQIAACEHNTETQALTVLYVPYFALTVLYVPYSLDG